MGGTGGERGRRRGSGSPAPGGSARDREARGEGGAEAPGALSRGIAAASGALVLLLVGYLVYETVTPAAPPVLSVRIAQGEVRRAGGAWYVPLEVTNEGDAPAKEVSLRTTLEPGPGAGEPSEVETVVDYLAGGEERRVYAVLGRDPAGGRLAAHVLGYQEP